MIIFYDLRRNDAFSVYVIQTISPSGSHKPNCFLVQHKSHFNDYLMSCKQLKSKNKSMKITFFVFIKL